MWMKNLIQINTGHDVILCLAPTLFLLQTYFQQHSGELPLVMLLQARIAGFIFRIFHLDWTPDFCLYCLRQSLGKVPQQAAQLLSPTTDTWASLHLCDGKNNKGPLGVLFLSPLSFSFILEGIIMLTQLSLHLMLSSSVGEDCKSKCMEVPAYGMTPVHWEFLKGICK